MKAGIGYRPANHFIADLITIFMKVPACTYVFMDEVVDDWEGKRNSCDPTQFQGSIQQP